MNYRGVLLITELGGDVSADVALIRRVAPAAERLVVAAHLPLRQFAWFTAEAPGDVGAAATSSLDRLRDLTAGAARQTEITLIPEWSTDTLRAIVAQERIDLLAVAAIPLGGLSVVRELRKHEHVAVLWGGHPGPVERPIARILCVALGGRAERSVAAFLRDHGNPALRATVLVRGIHPPGQLATELDIAGISAQVDQLAVTGESQLFSAGISESVDDLDLLVLPRFPGMLLRASAAWPAPVLVLPPLARALTPIRRAIDVADVVDEKGVLRARIGYASGVGRHDPIPDQEVGFVANGRRVAVATSRNGFAELPVSVDGDALGVYRIAEQPAADPVAAVELSVTVIRPGERPLLLFEADLCDEDLSRLASLGGADSPELLAIRMRATCSCAELRARLRGAGMAARVADASAILDEGDALDVPEAVDPVRLSRVASRMRAAGFPVVAIVHDGPHAPRTIGFVAMRAGEVAATPWHPAVRASPSGSLGTRLDATTGAPVIEGNRIEIELDNAKARRWLLEAIAGSRERVHVQVYMALDDDIGQQMEAALAAAAGRGVTVRLLVDSLHGLHGSLGARNPLLDRIGSLEGVELRVSRPISGVPTFEELKRRDHRKIAVIDGATALIGGRNISHEYYTGFDEVRLTPGSRWREVPWLDAGARVEGPAVAAIERSFLEAWTESGGTAFAVPAPVAAGAARARVVVHHGLQDAATLEAYLALIETATSHVYAVNGFPLILEIQHALLRALRRGVRVCTLFGHLTPKHGGEPFEGPWASARTAATELVHSRMDALVAAGGEGYQFAVAERPGWAPGLGTVNPHVHAKVMSADGRICAVGSANLDITAGYWESELLLLVDDAAITQALESRIEELIAESVRVDRNDAEWQRATRHRAWMRHWPGALSV